MASGQVKLAKRLSAGDRIGVIAPSFTGATSAVSTYHRGLAALEAAGYVPVPMPFSESIDGLRSWCTGTPEQRASDIHSAFSDPSLKAVICTIGGMHSSQLLPLLDFDLIGANPKIFCGYSDITSLHHAIHARTGLVTFYGPAVIPQWGLVGGCPAYTKRHFRRLVGETKAAGPIPHADYEIHDLDYDSSERTGIPLNREPGKPRRVIREGVAEGPLLVGCLPSSRNLLGTDWQPDYRGRILVLETPEPPYGPDWADADLTHLRLAGCLDELAALVICRPFHFSNEETLLLDRIVLDHVSRFSYPVISGIEGGHTNPIPTYPIGVGASLRDTVLSIDGPAVN